MPRHISSMLTDECVYEKLAHVLAKSSDVLFLGRGINYPLALEGALKLKEISYIHAVELSPNLGDGRAGQAAAVAG